MDGVRGTITVVTRTFDLSVGVGLGVPSLSSETRAGRDVRQETPACTTRGSAKRYQDLSSSFLASSSDEKGGANANAL
jgi:hypothetical protein